MRGQFRMALITNHPDALSQVRAVYLGDEREPHRVRRIQLLSGAKEVLVTLADFSSLDDVVAHKGQIVWIARADAPPLPEGEYYHYQLVGLDVVDLEGRSLGRLAEIIETGANDVYVIRGPLGETLLPAIADVVREVDPEGGRMVVQPPEYY